MTNVEVLEKGRLLKEALKIVDELAKNDLPDADDGGKITEDDFECEKLVKLIMRARELKRNILWRLT